MRTFDIRKPDEAIKDALTDMIDNLTKPKGALGVLEELALQVGWVQQTLTPCLRRPQNVLFAADHGIVEEGVSRSPKEITWQQISNFLHGGAGVNFLCRQHGFTLKIVDAGVMVPASLVAWRCESLKYAGQVMTSRCSGAISGNSR